MEKIIGDIKKLHSNQKLYVSCKKNYVLMFHKCWYSYRVTLLHRSDILGYSCFIKSFGFLGLGKAIKVLKQYY